MFVAAASGSVPVIKFLIEVGAASCLDLQDEEGCTPVRIAASNGFLDVVRCICEAGYAHTLLIQDNEGKTSSWGACAQGNVPLLKLIHSFGGGASFLMPDNDTDARTPFWIAVVRGRKEVLYALDKLGAGEGLAYLDSQGRTMAHIAAGEGKPEILRVICDLGYGSSLTKADKIGQYPVHLACLSGTEEVIITLNELGAGPTFSCKDKNGCTPAWIAASSGKADILHRLWKLGHGATLSQMDTRLNMVPATIANHHDHKAVLKLLKQLGALPPAKKFVPKISDPNSLIPPSEMTEKLRKKLKAQTQGSQGQGEAASAVVGRGQDDGSKDHAGDASLDADRAMQELLDLEEVRYVIDSSAS